MKVEYRTITKAGLCLGRTITIRHPLPESTEDCRALPDILYWGDDKIELDVRNMRPKLTRRIPNGYLTPRITAKNWEDFIVAAESNGLVSTH